MPGAIYMLIFFLFFQNMACYLLGMCGHTQIIACLSNQFAVLFYVSVVAG
jgi:hypothetical protein